MQATAQQPSPDPARQRVICAIDRTVPSLFCR